MTSHDGDDSDVTNDARGALLEMLDRRGRETCSKDAPRFVPSLVAQRC